MESESSSRPSQKVFRARLPYFLLGIGALVLVSVAGKVVLGPLMTAQGREEYRQGVEQSPFAFGLDFYRHTWGSLQKKVDEVWHAEEENQKLKFELTTLKLNFESLQFQCNSKSGEKATESLSLKLSQEAGARVGRTLASISYKPPAQLLPSQLYALAVSYMNTREDEKAAVIMTTLTGLEDSSLYKTAKNYLLTGVLWYRLENFVLSDSYFDEVLKMPSAEGSLSFQAQARLWKALVGKRLNDETRAQQWLKDLIDHHPHSSESAWVNVGEGKRVPAAAH